MKALVMAVLTVVMMVMVGCGQKSESMVYEARMVEFRAHHAEPNRPMMIGDSITQIWGTKATWPAGWTNRGIAGDTTGGVIKRLDEHLLEHPSEIVLLVGANNFNRTVGDYIAEMNTIIGRIISYNIPLTVISVLPAEDAQRNAAMQVFNVALKPLCDRYNVRFVYVYDQFTTNGVFNKELFADTVHPNDDGYVVMKRLFEERHIVEEVN